MPWVVQFFDKFKDCIIIENESFSLDVLNDLKMMHGVDVESELDSIIRQCTIRFPQTEDGNYIKGLFTLILKKQNEQMRLDKIKEDFE